MQVTSGRVVDGRVELETELPEAPRSRFSPEMPRKPSKPTRNLRLYYLSRWRKVSVANTFQPKNCFARCVAANE